MWYYWPRARSIAKCQSACLPIVSAAKLVTKSSQHRGYDGSPANPVDAHHNSTLRITLRFTRETNQIALIANYSYNTSGKQIVSVLTLVLTARVSVSEAKSSTPDTICPRLPL